MDLDPRTICLSVDVEWAHEEVLADLVRLFREREVAATFFVTHAGVDVGAFERGIHPNFRRSGDLQREFAARHDRAGSGVDEAATYDFVVRGTKAFAPEAVGVRAHSLFYDSTLLPVYHRNGIAYDSSYQMPLVAGIEPFWKEYDIVEIPLYYNDFYELKTGRLGWDARLLDLDSPGLKVFDIHPNTTFLNAPSLSHYENTRGFYHDPERLLGSRHQSRGARTFLLDLLDRVAAGGYPTATLGTVNAWWRATHPL